jgi:hypothetical protein
MAAQLQIGAGSREVGATEIKSEVHPGPQRLQPLLEAHLAHRALEGRQPLPGNLEREQLILNRSSEGVDEQACQITRRPTTGRRAIAPLGPGLRELTEHRVPQPAAFQPTAEGALPGAAPGQKQLPILLGEKATVSAVTTIGIAPLQLEGTPADSQEHRGADRDATGEGQVLQIEGAAAAEPSLQGLKA